MPLSLAGLSVFPSTHELFECIHCFLEGQRRIVGSSDLTFGKLIESKKKECGILRRNLLKRVNDLAKTALRLSTAQLVTT